MIASVLVDAKVRSGGPVYGVPTGFGRLADVTLPLEQRTAVQENLVRSHASGMGDPLARAEVRTLMLLRTKSLARGFSGCRVVVVARLLDLLNAGIHPRVPEFGYVGASGDLAPLAHVALSGCSAPSRASNTDGRCAPAPASSGRTRSYERTWRR